MPTSKNSGSALYYPHLESIDSAWLNLAALYYDHIWRIVPPRWDVDDFFTDVQKYVDAGFLRPRSPDEAAESIATDFEVFLVQVLDNRERKLRLINDLRLSRAVKRLSVGKMIYRLAQSLKERGLLREDGANWYHVEALTGALYMLFLAKRMAGSLPLVSDDPAFQQLVYGTPGVDDDSNDDMQGGSRTYRLASLVIRTVVPDNLAYIPADKILQVRKMAEEERVDFYDTINSLGTDLESIRDHNDAEDAIKHRQVAIMRSMKGLESKLRSQNIACVGGFMGLSIPSIATATWGFSVTNPIVLGALGAVAAGTMIAKTITDRKSAKLESHWSYLHTLRGELEGFFRQR